jgi:hypothetical protein
MGSPVSLQRDLTTGKKMFSSAIGTVKMYLESAEAELAVAKAEREDYKSKFQSSEKLAWEYERRRKEAEKQYEELEAKRREETKEQDELKEKLALVARVLNFTGA